MRRGRYKAEVHKIVPDGKYGPYVVCRNEELGWVTFALDPIVWKEKSNPKSGEFVYVSDVRQKSKGWRAQRARFVRPDETEVSKK